MGRCEKLLEKAREAPGNVSFSELCRLAECNGFVLDRTKGSHHIFRAPGVREILNLQRAPNGSANGYQVKQVLAHIQRLEGGADDSELG